MESQKIESDSTSQTSTRNGSLEEALLGNYELEIKPIFQEAWAKTKGVKWLIWLAFLIVSACSLILYIVSEAIVFEVMGLGGVSFLGDLILGWVADAFFVGLAAPLWLGVLMISIYRATNHSHSYRLIFQYFSKYGVLYKGSLLSTLLMCLGFVLFILPGIYLMVCYSFVLPLIGNRQLSVWQALEVSRKAVTKHWFKIFGIHLLLGLIIVISAIPLGIGLIWSVPFTYMVFGILYRNIFGVK